MDHGIAAGIQVRDHAVLCPLWIMAADSVDDTLVFHAALGAVLIVRHRDHNADRRGDNRDEIGQHMVSAAFGKIPVELCVGGGIILLRFDQARHPVSYTHLTLPTN